ncbi:CAP domain-containing protein [Streptomyces sp. NPDC012756]|uniref:CAP domain-containing protein n=1 Tax=Streptomyces sp. NPDC012756 TaxID=3364847 RepID=UPI0036AE894A
MRHHDRPGHTESVQGPARPDRLDDHRPRAVGRHRRAGGTRRRGPRRPSFRTAVLLGGSAAAVLTVVTGMYVATPATGTTPAGAPEEVAAVPVQVAAAPGQAAAGKAARFVQDVVELANAEREKAGCGPLRSEGHLRNAAQGHADDMAARDYYEHHSPEGRDAGDRMSGAGYAWSAWGENIHRGPKTPAKAMADWMDSPGHRANILNCSFRDIGVGVTLAANGPWWVQDFGIRR